MPFLITLAAGAITVAIVAIAIGSQHSTVHQRTIALPAPTRASTPPPDVHP